MKRLILIAMLVSGCSQPFSAAFVDTMMGSCLRNGMSAAQCNCRVQELQKRASQADVDKSLASAAAGAPQDPKFWQATSEAVAACEGR